MQGHRAMETQTSSHQTHPNLSANKERNRYSLKETIVQPSGAITAIEFVPPSAAATAASTSAVAARPTSSSGRAPEVQSDGEMGTSTVMSYQNGINEDRGSSVYQLEQAGLRRTASSASMSRHSRNASSVSRSTTLRKQKSWRGPSLHRGASKRSSRAGSIMGITYDDTSGVDTRSVFYSPVPTSGSPTDILANRFQAWRKFLKDLVSYFREVQNSYDSRTKAFNKVSNAISNFNTPTIFLEQGGLNDATEILRNHHRQALTQLSNSRDALSEAIVQLSSLRSDLAQKIKEIKSLSGDFKNSVDKEQEATRKAVATLQEVVSTIEVDPHAAVVGKNDPYLVRLAVDRQVDRQIDEENYLHRAYLNLEGSGRELESIVVGEVQKAYNTLASVLKREADATYDSVQKLTTGPITMPKDLEWKDFVEKDSQFVSPDFPLRRVEDVEYPGKNHPAAAEVRAGMLERKSKYLKSYTPGWYVLSPTHLHEFKSADRLYTQPPIMSLYLADQELGAHSQPGSASHKFIIKGRQIGGMHRGHSWVFRAESYETMLSWFDDIKNLTEKSGEERNAYVRRHSRQMSGRSTGSISSFEDDEADRVPYSANNTLQDTVETAGIEGEPLRRPQPGGRFPSDVQADLRSQPRELHDRELYASTDDERETTAVNPNSAVQRYASIKSYTPGTEQEDAINRGVVRSQATDVEPSAIQNREIPPTTTDVLPVPTASVAPQSNQPVLEQNREVKQPIHEFYTPSKEDLVHTTVTAQSDDSAPEAAPVQTQAEPPVSTVRYSRFREEFQPNTARTVVDKQRAPQVAAEPTGKTGEQQYESGLIPNTETTAIIPPTTYNTAESGSHELVDRPRDISASIEKGKSPVRSDLQDLGSPKDGLNRRETDVSVSKLHVPGRYPKGTVTT